MPAPRSFTPEQRPDRCRAPVTFPARKIFRSRVSSKMQPTSLRASRPFARFLANFFEIGGGVGARGKAETMFHCKRRMQLRRSQLPIDALRDVKKAGHVSFVRRLQRPRH